MELIHVSGNTDCLLGKTAVGIYRIDDTRCILFDNGYSKEYDELVGSLKDAGLTPTGLIVSHAHIDHHGNSKRLRSSCWLKSAFQSAKKCKRKYHLVVIRTGGNIPYIIRNVPYFVDVIQIFFCASAIIVLLLFCI